ncbi:hypothetical protein [Nitrosospira sp. Nsp11]|nr:hypothetical protein [Nitrosospira sp. Nsp11]
MTGKAYRVAAGVVCDSRAMLAVDSGMMAPAMIPRMQTECATDERS